MADAVPSADDIEAVAIVGMALRVPGALGVDRFWENLRDGVESTRFFSDEELRAAGVPEAALNDPAYVKAFGALEGADRFARLAALGRHDPGRCPLRAAE